MLTQLDIENIAVIEKASVEFENGFNVITGETSAGKSLLINSLNMVLGDRATRGVIREGTGYAKVSAFFYDKKIENTLRELDIPFDDGNIVITRKIYPDGRNVCHINQTAVNVSILKTVGEKLVAVHGQRDSSELFDTSSHIDFLDNFAGSKDLLEKYTAEFSEYKEAQKKLNILTMDDNARQNEIDYLRYQTEEIEKANLSLAEEEELLSRRNILENAEALSSLAQDAYTALNRDGGAKDALYSAKHALESLSSTDEGTSSLAERIANIYYEAEDLARDVSNYRASVEFNPSELAEINDRLDVINSLKRKYNKSIEEILAFYDEACQKLSTLLSYDEDRQSLLDKVDELKNKAMKTASELSSLRREKAILLSQKLCEELAQLDMPKCRIEFGFTETELSGKGIDSVELMISTNPSDAPKPLAKIASGGEISRVMIAIKSVFSDFDDATTIVFDEIDTGVSGSAAEKIARKMHALSSKFQLISITHLPIIAAAAGNHILLKKNTDTDSFKTNIVTLTTQMREEEIARIISGDKINDAAIENARQMLKLFG